MVAPKERDQILIVEDDQNVAEMLCTFLRTKKYRLLTTPMGEDVVEICQRERPSLVLLDINLPDIDGYEVCRRLRENLATSSIPIVFLTQKNLRQDKICGLDLGADDYITKPFDMDELHLRMRSVLRRAKYRAGIDQASGLPGGPLVEGRLKALLSREDWAILLVSVENFDYFTRQYRHLKGKFAQYIGQLVRRAVNDLGNFEDFVGRVGTVEFIVVTTPPRVLRLQERIAFLFTRAMYPPNEGDVKPVTADLYLAFGVVTAQNGPFSDVRSLSEAVSKSKRIG